jgi:hypothetical protein
VAVAEELTPPDAWVLCTRRSRVLVVGLAICVCCHQPPAVNYIEVLAKVDFPCRVHLQMYLLLDFTKSENGPIVHFWWLVVVCLQTWIWEHRGSDRK